MIPQFSILPPLLPETVAFAGQTALDGEFSNIFKLEEIALPEFEAAIDTQAPGLLQAMVLVIPPLIDTPAAEAPPPVEATAGAAALANAMGLPPTEPPSPPNTEIAPQPFAGPTQAEVALAGPTQADVAQAEVELAPLTDQPHATAVVMATSPVAVRIIAQSGDSSRQSAVMSRAKSEVKTGAAIETGDEDTAPSAQEALPAKVDPPSPTEIGATEPDIPPPDITEPEPNQTRISPHVVSITNLPQAEAPASPPHVTPKAAVQLILDQAAKPESGPVEVVLNPQELGHLRFRIHHNGEQVNIVLTVERPDTLDLMRRHGDQLLTDLRHLGISDATLSFGQWGHGDSGENRQDPPLLIEHPPLATPAFIPAPQWPSCADLGGQGLNLRL
jgi:hypothetical protein